MRPLLEKLRKVYPSLPSRASHQALAEFEKVLGRRLPGALRSLYMDHNGEPVGAPVYRLLPLHDAYPVSPGVWCFWEARYDPSGAGADYHFADGSVHLDHRTFPNVSTFLEDLLNGPLVLAQSGPALPEVFFLAEKLDCAERSAALVQAIGQAPAELAPRLLGYLKDDEEEVVVAVCQWLARAGLKDGIAPLARVTHPQKAREAARLALESLGGRILEYEVRAPVPEELQAVVAEVFGERTGGSMTLLKTNAQSKWQWVSCTPPGNPALQELPQGVRQRPGLYFGSLDGYGNQAVALEVIANAVDQFLQGQATQIWVSHDHWTLEVRDDGSGYPLDSELGERYLSRFHDSATGDQHAPHVHLVTRGVGLAPVNAVCSEFQVESVRNGQGYRLCYRRGELDCQERVELDFAAGTRVRLNLDPEIWESGFQAGPLRRRLFDFVHLIPGLVLTLNEERFHSPRGLLDLAEFDTDTRFEPCLGFQGKTQFLQLSIAAIGHSQRKMHIESWVNGARTEEHGSHVDGALEALQEVGWRPARVLVHVIMNEPQYAGPVRRCLRVPKALRQVRELLRRELQKMPNFTITLHLDQSVDRQEALRRLRALPNRPGNVRWSLAGPSHQHTADRIGRYTGVQVGDFSIVLTGAQPENWDLLVDLLDYGDDAVALHNWTDILLIQRDGKLTLDSQNSDAIRNHVLRRRQAKVEPLGHLEALD